MLVTRLLERDYIWVLTVGKDATLLDSKKKYEETRFRGFYESLLLQHLRPVKYNLCEQLRYHLYYPPSKDNDPEYVCAYCRKICITKAILKLHLKATQHHSDHVVGKEESEVENVGRMKDAPVISN